MLPVLPVIVGIAAGAALAHYGDKVKNAETFDKLRKMKERSKRYKADVREVCVQAKDAIKEIKSEANKHIGDVLANKLPALRALRDKFRADVKDIFCASKTTEEEKSTCCCNQKQETPSATEPVKEAAAPVKESQKDDLTSIPVSDLQEATPTETTDHEKAKS